MKTHYYALVLALACGGCSLGSNARSKSAETIAASHDSVITRSLRGEMFPSVSVSGSNNAVRIGSFPLESSVSVADSSNTKGTAQAAASRSFSFSVSTWIAFALAMIGLALALVAWCLFSKLTAAGKATDNAFSAAVDLASSGLPTDKVVAGLEKLRGKVSRRT